MYCHVGRGSACRRLDDINVKLDAKKYDNEAQGKNESSRVEQVGRSIYFLSILSTFGIAVRDGEHH